MSIHEALDFDREKVSIITPCYNAKKYIATTYNSLKNQTYKNWEWVVFDDQSTDDSFEIFQSLAKDDPRIIIEKNLKNSGAAITRNNCLNSASGHYVAFLDVDDLWDSQKLEKQIKFMQQKQVDFSYHTYRLIGPSGEVIKSIDVPSKVDSQDLLKFNPFATSSVVIKKSSIDEINLRFKEHLIRRQDYLFWYEAIKHIGCSTAIEEELSSYRVFGDDSLSGNKKKMAAIQLKLYRNEFNLNLIQSIYYFVQYAAHGVKKYFF